MMRFASFNGHVQVCESSIGDKMALVCSSVTKSWKEGLSYTSLFRTRGSWIKKKKQERNCYEELMKCPILPFYSGYN